MPRIALTEVHGGQPLAAKLVTPHGKLETTEADEAPNWKSHVGASIVLTIA